MNLQANQQTLGQTSVLQETHLIAGQISPPQSSVHYRHEERHLSKDLFEIKYGVKGQSHWEGTSISNLPKLSRKLLGMALCDNGQNFRIKH